MVHPSSPPTIPPSLSPPPTPWTPWIISFSPRRPIIQTWSSSFTTISSDPIIPHYPRQPQPYFMSPGLFSRMQTPVVSDCIITVTPDAVDMHGLPAGLAYPRLASPSAFEGVLRKETIPPAPSSASSSATDMQIYTTRELTLSRRMSTPTPLPKTSSSRAPKRVPSPSPSPSFISSSSFTSSSCTPSPPPLSDLAVVSMPYPQADGIATAVLWRLEQLTRPNPPPLLTPQLHLLPDPCDTPAQRMEKAVGMAKYARDTTEQLREVRNIPKARSPMRWWREDQAIRNVILVKLWSWWRELGGLAGEYREEFIDRAWDLWTEGREYVNELEEGDEEDEDEEAEAWEGEEGNEDNVKNFYSDVYNMTDEYESENQQTTDERQVRIAGTIWAIRNVKAAHSMHRNLSNSPVAIPLSPLPPNSFSSLATLTAVAPEGGRPIQTPPEGSAEENTAEKSAKDGVTTPQTPDRVGEASTTPPSPTDPFTDDAILARIDQRVDQVLCTRFGETLGEMVSRLAREACETKMAGVEDWLEEELEERIERAIKRRKTVENVEGEKAKKGRVVEDGDRNGVEEMKRKAMEEEEAVEVDEAVEEEESVEEEEAVEEEEVTMEGQVLLSAPVLQLQKAVVEDWISKKTIRLVGEMAEALRKWEQAKE